MNNATRNSTTAGKIVNMMSVDVQQIMERMDGIFFGLTTPVQVIVAVVMLYQVVGQLSMSSISHTTSEAITQLYIS